MRLQITLAILLLPVLALSAKAEEVNSLRATFGAITYRLSCAVCHGATARGEGEFASSLSVPAPDLTRLSKRHGGVFPSDYVTKVIAGGAGVTVHGGQMPAWGLIFLKDFEDWTRDTPRDDAALVKRRVGDLVEYLRQIQVLE